MVAVEIAIVLRSSMPEISSRRTGMVPELPGSRGSVHQNKRREMMRRVSTCLAVLGLAVLGLSASASAAPTITFKAVAVPIPADFPGTGNILGAGAALQAEFTISGTEYGGFPPPLIGVTVYGPAGVKLHPQGFATCAPSVTERKGPAQRVRRSRMPARGRAQRRRQLRHRTRGRDGVGAAVLRPRRRTGVLRDGTTPVSIEILSKGSVVSSSPPFGPRSTSRSAADRIGAWSARRVGRSRSTSRSAPRTRRARRRSPTGRCRRSARRAASR